MNRLLLGLSLLATFFAPSLGQSATVEALAVSTVDLGYGKYQAFLNTATNTTNFIGIRYAQSPTGDLRWKAPQAPPPSPAAPVQNATTQPNMCYQGTQGFNETSNRFSPNSASQIQARAAVVPSPSEDCLFLSVHIPGSLPSKKLLPVVVWIHGGGYVLGRGSNFDGSDLVVEGNHEVISVIIQYRLGLFGFLSSEEVKKGGQLNAGLLDQEFALKWVQQHIRKFGGDPNKVTIWGQSAGANSVIQLAASRDGRSAPGPKLFRAAMTSSTFLPPQYKYNDPVPQSIYRLAVAQSNCTNARDTLSCLRSADINTLQAANLAISGSAFWGTYIFIPVIDGEFITQRPAVAIANGKLSVDKWFLVTNANEGGIYVSPNSTLSAGEYAQLLFPLLSSQQVQQIATLYQGLGNNFQQSTAIHGESIFTCPSYYILQKFSGKAHKGEFAISPALHIDERQYYFPHTANPNGSPFFNNTDFINSFSQSYLSFAITLDPNDKVAGNLTPNWPSWTPSGCAEVVFNKTTTNQPDIKLITTNKDLLERCKFWQSVIDRTVQ